jgi:CheY-like chemotaxis protein
MKQTSILCVDDEPHILSALKRVLRNEGYELYLTTKASDGLSIMEREAVQLVLSDQRMPEMTGIEFLQRVKTRFPSTVRVILSGYADTGMMVDAINKGEIFRFMSKPWNDAELKAVIRQGLEHYAIVAENRVLLQKIQMQNDELRRFNRDLKAEVEGNRSMLSHAQHILSVVPVPVIVVDAEDAIAFANPAAVRITPPLQTSGQTALRLVCPSDVAEAVVRVNRGASTLERFTRRWYGVDVYVRVFALGPESGFGGCAIMLGGLQICHAAGGGLQEPCGACGAPPAAGPEAPRPPEATVS